MGARGRKAQVRWWARDGGGYYYKNKLLVRCAADDSPDGPSYAAALRAVEKADRQDAGKGTDDFALSALMNAYRQFLADEGRTASLNNVHHFLKPLCDRHGATPVGGLRGHHVRDFLGDAKTWGASSKRLAVKMLSAALNWGVKDGLIAANPLKGRMPMPKDTPRGREARLSPELVRLLVENADPEFRKLLAFWRDTGARPEEAEQAEAFNYRSGRIVYRWNAAEGHLHKQAKRGKEKDRVIFLTPELRGVVEAQIALHPRGKIFRTVRGKEWTKDLRWHAWDSLLRKKPVAAFVKANGLKRKHLVVYSLRHSFISQWVDDGRSIKVVADLCGTSVAIVEKHYAHAADERLEEMYLNFMKSQG
jgi:integrase